MTQQEIKFRRDLLGVERTMGRVQITEEKILEYCRLIGERNPLYTDPEAARRRGFRSVLVPVTFLAMFVSMQGYPDIRLDFPGVSVKGGQSIEMLRPVQAGDTLEMKLHLKDVFTKTGRSGTMAFVVWETTFTNQDGEVVALSQDHFIRYPRRDNGGAAYAT